MKKYLLASIISIAFIGLLVPLISYGQVASLWKIVPGSSNPTQVSPLNNNTTVTIPWITGTQCIHSVSGVLQGTGSDCGSGGGGSGSTTIITTLSSPYLQVAQSGSNATLTLASVLSLANNSSAGGINFSSATGTAIQGTLNSLNISQFTNNVPYLTSSALTPYLSTTTAAATYYLQSNPSNYITASALTPYLSTATAASTYYLQSNPSGYITASSLIPYLSTTSAASLYYSISNPSGYITSSALIPYLSTTSAASTYYLQTNPSNYISGNQSITLSGDVSGSGATSITTTLATVNSNVGSFGGASQMLQATVNAKGLVTAISTTTPSIPVGDITGVLPVGSGGTGTTTPGLIQGANITITGTWPFQTVAVTNSPSFSGTLGVTGTSTLATTTTTSLTASNLGTCGNGVITTAGGLFGCNGSAFLTSSSGVTTFNGSSGATTYGVVSANKLITVSTTTAVATLTASTSPTFTNLYLTNPLAIAQGGTGQTILASNTILLGNGTGAVATSSVGTAGQLFTGQTTTPLWETMSGDATFASTGVITLKNTGPGAGSYTYSGITIDAQGRVTAASSGTAPVTAITCSGSLATCTGTTPTIQLQNLASNDILFGQGNNTIGTSSNFTWNGNTLAITGSTTVSNLLTVGGTLNVTGTSSLTALNTTGFSNLATTTISQLTTTGTINGATITGGSLSATAVNGITTASILLSTGSYSNPSWLTSIQGSIVSGNISGNAANVTGIVAVGNGGTGTSTAPSLNQLLIGNGAGGYAFTSTSSLGLQPAGTYVTSVTGSGNIASSGGTTPNITLTGVIPVANGGTGQSILTANDLLFGNGSSGVASSSQLYYVNNVFNASSSVITNATGTTLDISSTMLIPAASAPILATSGQIEVNTTANTLSFNSGGTQEYLNPVKLLYPFYVENPIANEDDALMIANATTTITAVYCVNKGPNDSATFNIVWDNSRQTATTSAASKLFSSMTTCAATTTPVSMGSFASTTINTLQIARIDFGTASTSGLTVDIYGEENQ